MSNNVSWVAQRSELSSLTSASLFVEDTYKQKEWGKETSTERPEVYLLLVTISFDSDDVNAMRRASSRCTVVRACEIPHPFHNIQTTGQKRFTTSSVSLNPLKWHNFLSCYHRPRIYIQQHLAQIFWNENLSGSMFRPLTLIFPSPHGMCLWKEATPPSYTMFLCLMPWCCTIYIAYVVVALW